MGVKVILALTALAAVVVGLALPGPAVGHKPQPKSSLQTLELRRS